MPWMSSQTLGQMESTVELVWGGTGALWGHRWIDLSLSTPFTQLGAVCASPPEPSLVFILTQTHCRRQGFVLYSAAVLVFSLCILWLSLLSLFSWLKLEILEVEVNLWVVVPNPAKRRPFPPVVPLGTFHHDLRRRRCWSGATSPFPQQHPQEAPAPVPWWSVLCLQHSHCCQLRSPSWIGRSRSLIQEGSCSHSFLPLESVCSELRTDLEWRSMEVWQDHRLV